MFKKTGLPRKKGIGEWVKCLHFQLWRCRNKIKTVLKSKDYEDLKMLVLFEIELMFIHRNGLQFKLFSSNLRYFWDILFVGCLDTQQYIQKLINWGI